ncbi:uncharacterized protein LOC131939258 [Physella acuta]|uniref:uncharacterized protein LOC131939258 n=1 Tax=Physella acuta TaxID=109671 RepID=UPI0027DD6496|nr:uncharacterized protein LOC131939258 [Physella acuta]
MLSYSQVKALVFLVCAVGVYSDCREEDWSASFDFQGLSECKRPGDVISGFYRRDADAVGDGLRKLDTVECCSKPAQWKLSVDYVVANWWSVLNKPNTWATCQPGHFLAGLYRTLANNELSDIEEGRCIKAGDHPDSYGECSDVDISSCIKKAGWCKCPDETYVVGIYRGRCNDLSCLVKLRCCKFAEA